MHGCRAFLGGDVNCFSINGIGDRFVLNSGRANHFFRFSLHGRKPVFIFLTSVSVQAAVSDDSGFVNGQTIVVDGGVTGGRMWSDYTKGLEELTKKLGVR